VVGGRSLLTGLSGYLARCFSRVRALHHIAQLLLEPFMFAPGTIAGTGLTFMGGARVERHVGQCQDASLFLGR
jgi:hypothetical protein